MKNIDGESETEKEAPFTEKGKFKSHCERDIYRKQ